jgi:hypothetical protein
MAPIDEENRDGQTAGWIDVPICEDILSIPARLICAVDGSETAMTAFHFVTECIMQSDRNTNLHALHLWSANDDNLPPAWRKDSLRGVVEAKLTGSLSQKRYSLSWKTLKPNAKFGDQIVDEIEDIRADYACLGFTGRKNKEDKHILASSVLEVLQRGKCTCIVIKDQEVSLLPQSRPAIIVVPVSLNKTSTRGFLDAVRLSKPGDQIHVIYCKSYMEKEESDYTAALRVKYEGFFQAFRGDSSKVFSKFHDRDTKFAIIEKRRRESLAQAIVRYAEGINADFLVVGTNCLRGEKGSPIQGSMALQMIMDFERNFMISNWVDVNPRVYEDSVRPMSQSKRNR